MEVNNPALIFNCHYNGLSIIQELSQHGIKCYALDSKRSVGTFSKYAKFIKVTSPKENEKLFIKELIDICDNFEYKPVLFPTNDEWAAAISKYKTKLEEYSYPCVSDWENVGLILNKDKFYDWGMDNNYPVPKTYHYEDLKKIKKNDFPLLSKPKYRRMTSDESNENFNYKKMDELRFKIHKDKGQLNNFIKKNIEYKNSLLIQKFVTGMSNNMYTIGVYADENSEIKELFTGRKVRGYPADSGDCIVGQYEKMPIEIIELTKKLINDLNYTGIAEIEFKKDEKSGKYYLIEINPRSWSWIGITPFVGNNIPLIAYLDLTDQALVKNNNGKQLETGDVKYIKLFQDFLNTQFKYRNDYPVWKMDFLEWLKDIKAQKLVVAEYNYDDWPIFIYSIFIIFKSAIKKMLKKFGLI